MGGLAAGDAGAALAGTVAAGATVAGDTGAAISVLEPGWRLWRLKRKEERRRKKARRSGAGLKRDLRNDAGDRPGQLRNCARTAQQRARLVDGGSGEPPHRRRPVAGDPMNAAYFRRLCLQDHILKMRWNRGKQVTGPGIPAQSLSGSVRTLNTAGCQNTLPTRVLEGRRAFRLFLFELSQPKQPVSILTIKEATAKPMNDRSV